MTPKQQEILNQLIGCKVKFEATNHKSPQIIQIDQDTAIELSKLEVNDWPQTITREEASRLVEAFIIEGETAIERTGLWWSQNEGKIPIKVEIVNSESRIIEAN